MKKIIKNILLPVIAYTTKYKGWRYFKEYINSEYEPVEIRKKRQWEKIAAILKHAYINVPFYKDKFNKVGIRPEDIKSESDFIKIPITTKTELHNNFPNNIIAKNYNLRNVRFSNTSGTSGRHLILVQDNTDINYKYASKLRSFYLMGSEIGDKLLRIAPNECQPCFSEGCTRDINFLKYFKMKFTQDKDFGQAHYIFLENKLINPILHKRRFPPPLKADFKDKDLDFFIEEINNFKPDLLTGYPLYLYLIAKHIEKKNIHIKRVKAIDLTAGLSTESLRRYFAQQFNAPVYQAYGGCEFGRIATSCKYSNGLMHILEDLCFVEFIDQKGETVPEYTLGNIIVTSLTNYAMPLIRYEIGDVGWYSNNLCLCERTTKLMDIEGRLQDLIVTREGKILTEKVFFDHFLNYPGLRFFQLLQLDLDKYEFLMVKEDSEKINHEQIEKDLRKILGNHVYLDLKYVDYIVPASSGKYRLVKSCSYNHFRYASHSSIPLGNFW